MAEIQRPVIVANIVQIMRDKSEGNRNRLGDEWGDHWCKYAADEIEWLRSRLSNTEGGDKP